ncbi:hypothetical protein DFH06DRAFT_1338922 [Mycena polygramma]|nr:hypothetical protein DFH06DRAFT_1338922 [Mycena polygramma]
MDYLDAYEDSDSASGDETRDTRELQERGRTGGYHKEELGVAHPPCKRRRTRHSYAARYLDVEAAVDEGSDEDEGESDADSFIADGAPEVFEPRVSRHLGRDTEDRREAEELESQAHEYQVRARREREAAYGAAGGGKEDAIRSPPKAGRVRQERQAEEARRERGEAARASAVRPLDEPLEEEGRLRRALQGAPKGHLVLVESAQTILMVVREGPTGWRLGRFTVKAGRRLEDVLRPEDWPSPAEITEWDGVDAEILGAAANPRLGMALRPGCRVVVDDSDRGPDHGKSGFITEMQYNGQVARVRISVDGERILQSDPRLYDLLTWPTANAGANKIEEIDVMVGDLKRHLLCVPCRLRDLDRVWVVRKDSPGRGVRGRVSQIETSGDDPQVTIATEENEDIEVPMSHVTREFALGDLVDVVTGPLTGEQGIIVEMVAGGGLQIFATSSSAVERSAQVMKTLFDEDLLPSKQEEDILAKPYGLLHVIAEQVEFAQPDARPGGWSKSGDCEPARCSRYKGTEVLIVRPHPMKGQWGVVQDEHDVVLPEDLDKPTGKRKVVLTVRDDASFRTWQVPLEQAVHRWTRLPLNKSKYVIPWAGPLGWGEPEELPEVWGSEETMDTLSERGEAGSGKQTVEEFWAESAKASMDAAWKTSPPARLPPQPGLIGDGSDGGRWLCIPELKGKRVDVGVLEKKGQHTETHAAAVGKCSYVELEEALTPQMMNKRITIRAGDKAKKLRLEPRWLVPWRMLPPVKGRAVSIVDGRGRVVIIGPDHLGNTEFLGKYGLTGASGGPGWVWVKFERAKDTAGMQSLFHEQSLCRSYNDDGVWTKATVFL